MDTGATDEHTLHTAEPHLINVNTSGSWNLKGFCDVYLDESSTHCQNDNITTSDLGHSSF